VAANNASGIAFFNAASLEPVHPTKVSEMVAFVKLKDIDTIVRKMMRERFMAAYG